jgi:acyl-CoA synthetase (AMP-forming)/AMP-acid ligase II
VIDRAPHRFGDERRPAGLVAGAQAGAGVAVEVFVEQQVVARAGTASCSATGTIRRRRATLAAFCKGRIATYKIPHYWKFVDAFPMTVTGKVQKFRIREIAIQDLALG